MTYIKHFFLFVLMVVTAILIVSTPVFAATSIHRGWIALDKDKNPVLYGSQYQLSGKVKPIAFISNGATIKSVDEKSVVYLGNDKVGTAMALVIGDSIPGYKDAFITMFTITNGVSIDKATVTIKPQIYTGAELKPDVAVSVSGQVLKRGVDYDVEYSKNIAAGTGSAKIIGKGNYKGVKNSTFKISPRSLKDGGRIDSIPVQPLIKGKQTCPSVTVKYGTKKLSASDYSVTYGKNNTIGKNAGSVTVTGKGNYTDTLSISFAIEDNSKVVLNHSVMMIDNVKFNKVKLTAKIKDNKGYSASDIKWTITPNSSYKDAASFSSSKTVRSKKGGASAWIYGKKWSGNTPISVSATLPNGSKATCKLRVISSSTKNDVGAGSYSHDGAVHYLCMSISKKQGKVLKTPTYGNNFVEEYLNNAEWLVKNLGKKSGNKYSEEYKSHKLVSYLEKNLNFKWTGKKFTWNKNVHGMPQGADSSTIRNLCKKVVHTKKPGEISANGWVYFFSSKNQWQYLAHKDAKTGKWKVYNSSRSSAGKCRNEYNWDDYLSCIFYCTSYTCPAATYGWVNTNKQGTGVTSTGYPLVHKDTNGGRGYPTSQGCVHAGHFDEKIYYDIMAKAGVGTRFIML